MSMSILDNYGILQGKRDRSAFYPDLKLKQFFSGDFQLTGIMYGKYYLISKNIGFPCLKRLNNPQN